MKLILTALFLMLYNFSYSQVHTEKQTRYRFAPLNIGLDFQYGLGTVFFRIDIFTIYKLQTG